MYLPRIVLRCAPETREMAQQSNLRRRKTSRAEFRATLLCHDKLEGAR